MKRSKTAALRQRVAERRARDAAAALDRRINVYATVRVFLPVGVTLRVSEVERRPAVEILAYQGAVFVRAEIDEFTFCYWRQEHLRDWAEGFASAWANRFRATWEEGEAEDAANSDDVRTYDEGNL